jgi:hypothetical protein
MSNKRKWGNGNSRPGDGVDAIAKDIKTGRKKNEEEEKVLRR